MIYQACSAVSDASHWICRMNSSTRRNCQWAMALLSKIYSSSEASRRREMWSLVKTCSTMWLVHSVLAGTTSALIKCISICGKRQRFTCIVSADIMAVWISWQLHGNCCFTFNITWCLCISIRDAFRYGRIGSVIGRSAWGWAMYIRTFPLALPAMT